jgi:putative transposase
MNEIMATLSALSPHLNRRTLNQLAIIVEAVLAMTGRVTMLGLFRWAEKGGSYMLAHIRARASGANTARN